MIPSQSEAVLTGQTHYPLLPESCHLSAQNTLTAPAENKNTNLKRYMHVSVHCCIIYNSQDMEAM